MMFVSRDGNVYIDPWENDMNHHLSSRRQNVRRRPLQTAGVLLALGTAGAAGAATIAGEAVDSSGMALSRVPVCLKTLNDGEGCSRLRHTDRQGAYRFNGIKPGSDYSVEIFLDKSAAARKFDNYRTYVWSPAEQPVTVSNRADSVYLAPFVGKFNFSNYQRVVQLTATDFPELNEFDLAGDYVFLKVSFASTEPERSPETVFLGQVTAAEQIRLEASVPLSTTSIDYEIYSTSHAISGSISLSES